MSATLRPGGTSFLFIPNVPLQGEDSPFSFPAFINSVDDSSTPMWNEFNDMGRGDPKFMYGSYSRTISVDFKVAAIYNGAHTDNLERLNSLAEMCKPKYRSGLGYNGIYGTMVIGEWINEIGFISSLDISVDNETPWVDDIPIYLNCNLSFRVIGSKKPNYKAAKGIFPGYGFSSATNPFRS